MPCHQSPAWQKPNHVTPLLDCTHGEHPGSARTGKDRERRLQGLPWTGSGTTINLEVNDPNSLDPLLKTVQVYLCVHAVSVPTSYVHALCVAGRPLCQRSPSFFPSFNAFSPALIASPLMLSCCPPCWLSSRHAMCETGTTGEATMWKI